MAFKVLDDFIHPGYQDLIKSTLDGALWSYFRDMDYDNDEELAGVDGAPSYSQFINIPFHHGNILNPELHHILLPLVSKIVSEDLLGYVLTRSRSILQIPSVERPDMYVPHVDTNGTGMVSAVYYVNDSDGDTVLFEESAYDVDMADRGTHQFKEEDRVSPKKGRLVIFPSSRYHCGSPPSKSDRMLINFNFERIPT